MAIVRNINGKTYLSGFEGERCPKCGCDKLELIGVTSFRCMNFDCRHSWSESVIKFSEAQNPNTWKVE